MRKLYSLPIYLLLSLTFWLANCSNEVSKEQYPTALSKQKEGLNKVIETPNFVYKVSYQPIAMQLLKAGDGEAVSIDDFLGHRYFNLSIEAKSQKTLDKILEAKQLTALKFHSQKKFYLKTDTETMPCVLYHALPAGVRGHQQEMILVFQDNEVQIDDSSTRDLTFVFEDDLLSNQMISTTFLAKDFNQLPKLKI